MDEVDAALIERGERAEIQVWEEAWDAAPPAICEAFGFSKERNGDVLVLRAGLFPWWGFNRMLGVGISGPADLSWMEAQFDRYAATDVPFGVSLCPGARPTGLAGWLEAKGLRQSSRLAKLMRSTGNLPKWDAAHSIREVGVEDARLFARTAVRGFEVHQAMAVLYEALPGREDWRFYLSFAAGEAVGTGALLIRGDVAWLGFDSTVPEHRRKGLQGAMITHRMHAAAGLGCRWLVTEIDRPNGDQPAPSFHNMLRLGFEVAYDRINYVMPLTA